MLSSGKAEPAISGVGYLGSFYSQVWSLPELKLGRPHLIVEAQLETLRKQQPIKAHNSHALINYSITITIF